MNELARRLWAVALRIVPTWALQAELVDRPTVFAQFIGPEDRCQISVPGVCWVIISQD